MSAQVRSLELGHTAPQPAADFPFGGPSERAATWGMRMFRAFLSNPTEDTGLHGGVIAIVIPQDDPAVANLNLAVAREAERQGKPVTYRYIDHRGYPLGGTEHRFTVDVSDARWGTQAHPELDDLSAGQLRQRLQAILSDSQHGETVKLAYGNLLVLNGVRIYLLDEPEPGIYTCIAFERAPF